jgi:hypothetical protein
MRKSTLWRLFLALALALGTVPAGLAQSDTQPAGRQTTRKPASRQAEQERRSEQAAQRLRESEAQKKEQGQSEAPLLEAGTKITAELETAVSAATAKPGDEVAARVTKNVKQNGEVVLKKGDRLVGRITDVQAASAAEAGSSLTVAFDRVVHGGATSELQAVVTSVLSTPSEERARREEAMREPEPMPTPMPAPSGGSSRGSSSGGGLLGGAASTVTSTVNSAAGATAPALGGASSTVNSATSATLGSQTGVGLSTPLRALRLESQAQAEHQSALGSTLSTRQGNLGLESGTRLQLRVVAQSERPAETAESPKNQ